MNSITVLFLLLTACALHCNGWQARKYPSNGIPEPKERKAFPLQTPHSGRHFRPSHPAYRSSFWRRILKRRMTEGWYYRLTLPDEGVSFAFITSIEDPGLSSDLRLACIQIVGPDDGYIVQSDRDDSLFWAWKRQQGQGCTFQLKEGYDVPQMRMETALAREEWLEKTKSGFQILPTQFLGRIRGRDGSVDCLLDDNGIGSGDEICDFDFEVDPLCGWGDVDGDQKSTAGWLSYFAVFEPHWQVTMADARATGTVIWKNQTYQFKNAPLYAEKNWGAALPKKWYWTQCNSFPGYDQLSVTAGGGIRTIPFGREEALGMVSVHYNGKFFEASPLTGTMNWRVKTWGSWVLEGSCTFGDRPFEVKIVYECDSVVTPGLVFRAPTPDEGMVRFCRDTFTANTTLTLWELEWNKASKTYERKSGPPLIAGAKSSQGGAEVGGGPWWDEWCGKSQLTQPIKFLLRFPLRFQNLRRKVKQRICRAKTRTTLEHKPGSINPPNR